MGKRGGGIVSTLRAARQKRGFEASKKGADFYSIQKESTPIRRNPGDSWQMHSCGCGRG